MTKYIKLFEDLEKESDLPIRDLPKREERPMVEGIAEILRQVKDKGNRREIAMGQIEEFGKEGIAFDYGEFLELCEL